MRHVVTPPLLREAKPLTETVFLILTSLADRPRHGYAVLEDIRQLSHGRVAMSTGTLYGAIRRLLEDGWIERFAQEDQSRDKQSYKLTGEGYRQLTLELARMKALTRAASARMKAVTS